MFKSKLYRNYPKFSTKFTVSREHYAPSNNMVNYTSWPIILPNMKAIWSMTSEELHSQSEVGRTNKQTNKQTNQQTNPKTISHILSTAGA
jgi:hypothetical protein